MDSIEKKASMTSMFLLMRFFSSIPFAILYSSLLLYIVGTMHLPSNQAIAITGGYLALNFALPMLGGLVSGVYLSHRSSFCLALILQAISGIFFLFQKPEMIYWALAFFLTGSALLSTSLNMLITNAYQNYNNREKAFLYNYASMNLGYFSGYFLAGFYGNIYDDYQAIFVISASLSTIALFTSVVFWKKLSSLTPKGKTDLCGFLFILILIPLIRLVFNYPKQLNWLIIVGWALSFIIIFCMTFRQADLKQKRKGLAFLILLLASVIFWSVYLIAPMGLMLFIEHNVILSIDNMTVAPQWFQTINTIVIVIGSPLLAYFLNRVSSKGLQIGIGTKFTIALGMMALGLFVLSASTYFSNTQGYVSMNWVIVSYVFQSTGELFIGPIGWAITGKLIHEKHQSLMMGFWIMILGVSSSFASLFSTKLLMGTNNETPVIDDPHFSHMFGIFGLITIMTALLLLLGLKKINRITA